MADKGRPYKAAEQENATEPPPKAVRRIAARNAKARERLSNPMNRIGERPIDKIREEQAEARQEYGQWHPPAFIRRANRSPDGSERAVKRCDDCKKGKHHKPGAAFCICRCPK